MAVPGGKSAAFICGCSASACLNISDEKRTVSRRSATLLFIFASRIGCDDLHNHRQLTCFRGYLPFSTKSTIQIKRRLSSIKLETLDVTKRKTSEGWFPSEVDCLLLTGFMQLPNIVRSHNPTHGCGTHPTLPTWRAVKASQVTSPSASVSTVSFSSSVRASAREPGSSLTPSLLRSLASR